MVFKIEVVKKKKLNELQKNSQRQFNELRNNNSEEKEHFAKEIEMIKKKNRTEILELKNYINEMKNASESTVNRADKMKVRFRKLKEKKSRNNSSKKKRERTQSLKNKRTI